MFLCATLFGQKLASNSTLDHKVVMSIAAFDNADVKINLRWTPLRQPIELNSQILCMTQRVFVLQRVLLRRTGSLKQQQLKLSQAERWRREEGTCFHFFHRERSSRDWLPRNLNELEPFSTLRAPRSAETPPLPRKSRLDIASDITTCQGRVLSMF